MDRTSQGTAGSNDVGHPHGRNADTFGELVEADPPRIVDPDAVLTLAVVLQGTQPIRGWKPEVFEARGCVEGVESGKGSGSRAGASGNTVDERSSRPPGSESS